MESGDFLEVAFKALGVLVVGFVLTVAFFSRGGGPPDFGAEEWA